jgi:phage major head subunit gpT-like protein
MATDNMPYRRVAMEFDLTAAVTTFVDLGGLPVPTQDSAAVDTMIEKGKTVEPKDWYIKVTISQNDIDDDQTGTLRQKFQGVLPAFVRHINNLTFEVLNAGDTATHGTGITNETEFFADAHLYPGGKNTTAQDNLNALDLDLPNFNTVWVAHSQRKDDQGNFYNLNPNLLVTHPNNNVVAANITGNAQAMDTANRKTNPYANGVQYFTVPQFDTTAWVVLDESYPVKPLFVAIRKRPMLQGDPVFDPYQPRGGQWVFSYHGRYVVGYGDPMLCTMGKS